MLAHLSADLINEVISDYKKHTVISFMLKNVPLKDILSFIFEEYGFPHHPEVIEDKDYALTYRKIIRALGNKADPFEAITYVDYDFLTGFFETLYSSTCETVQRTIPDLVNPPTLVRGQPSTSPFQLNTFIIRL